MCVLRSILPDSRQISLDVAGIMRAAIKRRREQHDEPCIFAHEPPVKRLHCGPAALWIAGLRDHAPALRDRIDLTLCIHVRAEWCAVVVVCAAIPFSIPRRFLDRMLVRVSLFAE